MKKFCNLFLKILKSISWKCINKFRELRKKYNRDYVAMERDGGDEGIS